MHVDNDLSAYLDEELAPTDRARVAGHLATCERCAARLADLRATSSLIASLPGPRPARSLVPSVATRWTWLRPARSLSAVASAAFLFMFLLTAAGSSGLGAPASQLSPTSFSNNAPAAAPAPAPSGPAGPLGAAAPAATAAPTAAAQPPPAEAQKDAAASRASTGLGDARDRPLAYGIEPSPLSQPPLWLGLAIVAAIGALIAHVRLRESQA